MTIWELLSLCRRLWVVTLTGLLGTAAVGVLVTGAQGTYVGQVNVVLLAPQAIRGNALADTTQSLISMAGVVAHLAGGPGGTAKSVSDQVTLVGEGIRDGYAISQPNSGGQWEYRFDQPVLNVQSAGSTLSEATRQMNLALEAISSTLTTLEDQADAASDRRIALQLSPSQPTFSYSHGSRARALAAVGGIGLLLTVTAVVVVDQFGSRRRRRSFLPGDVRVPAGAGASR